MARRTKIVATLGPASWDEPTLTGILKAGVDVCRINCSHSDHDSIRRQVARIRRASMTLGKPVAILLDLQGPKIRTSDTEQPVELPNGSLLHLVMENAPQSRKHHIGTTFPQMASEVSVGERVLFADGALSGVVEEIDTNAKPAIVAIRMECGGKLGSHKGINLPDVALSIPALTKKDLADVNVGMEVGVDYVALSFVRRRQDVEQLREVIQQSGHDIPIIAKIEKAEAIEQFDSILQVVDGIMVARGDLGVEVNLEKVPVIQKHLIQCAFKAGKLAITATQMLDSMERNIRPTRAEVTDVANAILDGTDAVMLSGETATGAYPVESVRVMGAIAQEVENSRFFTPTAPEDLPTRSGLAGPVAKAACFAVTEKKRPLVVFTWSGASAVYASKARPDGAIFALTPEQTIVDQLALVWGVTPILIPKVESTDALIGMGEQVLLDSGRLQPGEEIVILAGQSPLVGAANILKIHAAGTDT